MMPLTCPSPLLLSCRGPGRREQVPTIHAVNSSDPAAMAPPAAALDEMVQAWQAHTSASKRLGMTGVRFYNVPGAVSKHAAADRYRLLYEQATATHEAWRSAKRDHRAALKETMLTVDAARLHRDAVVAQEVLVCGRCALPVPQPVAQRRWCCHWCYIDARRLRVGRPEPAVQPQRWQRHCEPTVLRSAVAGRVGRCR